MAIAVMAALALKTPARADILAPLERAVAAIGTAVSAAAAAGSPSPSPSPVASTLPKATPAPKAYQAPRGGRLRLSLNGSLSLGSHATSQTLFNGLGAEVSPSPSASPNGFIGSATTTAQSQSQGNLGMYAEITRRTASTSTDIRVPFSFSTSQRAYAGDTQVLFSTARYALGYGAQSTTVFGQLPAGSTLRGYYTILPMHGGDTTLYYGPTLGAQGEQIDMRGLRWRMSLGPELLEGGVILATGPLTGKSTTIVAGAAASFNALTLIGEGALQQRTGGDASPSGFTYQVRGDDGPMNSYLTFISRHIASNFVTFGSGENLGDDYLDFGYHRAAAMQNLSFDMSSERLGGGSFGSDSQNRLASLNYGGPLRFGTYTASLQSQQTSSSGITQSVGSASLQVSASLGRSFLLLGNNLSRTTQAGGLGGDSAQTGYSASYQMPVGTYSIGATYSAYRQTSQLDGPAVNSSIGINLSRQFGKTAITLFDTFGHSSGSLSNALQTNEQLTVTRTISPVISLQGAYGIQSLNDRLNPASNGRSRSFALQVNAPFSFGNALVSGPADPKLPATIIGRVMTDTSSNPTFAGLVSGGVSNALVILDDKTVQRTDVTGGFQFSFVTPGQHQIRIESGSLPRGVTVDIPIDTIQVQGGQTAQVTFLVGDFGGINGHVYGRDSTGSVIPLPNVMLRVDGGAYSQTDPGGSYGFGKLRPGNHVLTVIENSVPAFASFDPAKEKVTVDVKNGQYTTVDFTAEPLGSIAGTILFDKNEGPDSGSAVLNAYVVAEPGEHAAIANDDGSFVIDNLPPGDYTVSVDQETIPEGMGSSPDSLAVHLDSQEHYQGAGFVVGHQEKKVLFSFIGGGATSGAAAPTVRLSERRLPPNGMTVVTVDAPQSAGHVRVEGLGDPLELAYDEKRKTWVGELTVPGNTKVGPYTIAASAASGTQPQAATLVVDAKMPIALLQTDPANPIRGQYVRVRARFLVDAQAGDRIQWADGQISVLGRPLSGRVFTINLRLSLRPLHGVLLTKRSHLPIELM